jgi:hypothetical protein
MEEPAFAGSGDKVIYAFTEALRRVTRPTCGSLFEPRYEQDLSANPKRTAKFKLNFHDIDNAAWQSVQRNFRAGDGIHNVGSEHVHSQ